MEKLKSFQEDIMLSDRSELDEKYFHKSHKGKKLSDAEPKKRGTPARKRGISGIHLLPYRRIQGWSGLCRDTQHGKAFVG